MLLGLGGFRAEEGRCYASGCLLGWGDVSSRLERLGLGVRIEPHAGIQREMRSDLPGILRENAEELRPILPLGIAETLPD